MIKDEKMNKKNADLSEKNRATMIMKKKKKKIIILLTNCIPETKTKYKRNFDKNREKNIEKLAILR